MRIIRTPDEWHTLFDEQQRSGLNKTQFCRQHGITRSAFSNARHRLSNRNATDISFVPALPPCQPAASSLASTTDTQPTHAPVREDAATPQSLVSRQLALTLPGATLCLPADISPRWLATLLREIAP